MGCNQTQLLTMAQVYPAGCARNQPPEFQLWVMLCVWWSSFGNDRRMTVSNQTSLRLLSNLLSAHAPIHLSAATSLQKPSPQSSQMQPLMPEYQHICTQCPPVMQLCLLAYNHQSLVQYIDIYRPFLPKSQWSQWSYVHQLI